MPKFDEALKGKPTLKQEAKIDLLDNIFTVSYKSLIEDSDIFWHLHEKGLVNESIVDDLLNDWKEKLRETI